MKTALLAALAILPLPALAQGVQTLHFAQCMGGTAAPVTSVGTSATVVCSAGGVRQFFRVVAIAPNTGVFVLACTDDGSTPSASHYSWELTGGQSKDSQGMTVIPSDPIQCISVTNQNGATSSVTISAQAVQQFAP